jgi:hypothetical protein
VKTALLFGLLVLVLCPRETWAQEFTGINNCGGAAAGGSTTLSCGGNLTVQTGDLLVACGATSTIASTLTIQTETSGGAEFTMLTGRQTATSAEIRMGYYIVPGNDTYTPQVSYGTTANNRTFIVLQYRPAHTVSFVMGTDAGATGTGTTATSAAVSATGTSNLAALFCAKAEGGLDFSNDLIAGGAAASAATTGSAGSTAMRRFNSTNISTLSSATGTSDPSSSAAWAIVGAVFQTDISALNCGDGNLLGVYRCR